MKSSFEQFETLDHGRKRGDIAVEQLARRDPLAGRGLLHLQAVLVGAGEEEDVVAVEPLEAGDRIGRDRLVGVPDMRRAVGIGDRGRDVIRGLGHFGSSSLDCRRCPVGRTKKQKISRIRELAAAERADWYQPARRRGKDGRAPVARVELFAKPGAASRKAPAVARAPAGLQPLSAPPPQGSRTPRKPAACDRDCTPRRPASARFTLSHASAIRAARSGLPSSPARRADSQSRTVSTNVRRAPVSLAGSTSPSAWSAFGSVAGRAPSSFVTALAQRERRRRAG